MTLNVHLLNEYTPEIINHLKAQLDNSIHLVVGDPAEINADIHILVDGRPKRDLIDSYTNLRALIVPWTGLPPETHALLSDYPHIAVHNLHHNAPPVAEMTISLLLAAAKYVIPFDRALRQDDWTLRYENPPRSLLLHGKTVLILGYGAIGRLVAATCRAMGMHVVALKRSLDNGDEVHPAHEIHSNDRMADLLPRAQVVIVALPLTQETEGLLGEEELSLLPPDSVLVNIGRALIIDEEALYLSLKNGQLGAAGLDVWYNYPDDEESRTHTPPANFPFGELDNVVLSPHRAGHTSEINYLRMDHLAVLLNAAAKNERIPNKVDLNTGY